MLYESLWGVSDALGSKKLHNDDVRHEFAEFSFFSFFGVFAKHLQPFDVQAQEFSGTWELPHHILQYL